MPVNASNENRAADELAGLRALDYAINFRFVSERLSELAVPKLVVIRTRPSYLTHFTCAFTATACGVDDIWFDTTKW
jgi:hypothetical protein